MENKCYQWIKAEQLYGVFESDVPLASNNFFTFNPLAHLTSPHTPSLWQYNYNLAGEN